ncbi:PqqD family protein [Micromonospora sp. LOL_024]|uniref:PqqD family protein n=1 Tax=Micromonospora sp. LOL_024 TaxID=3345412 RepID=UPI003A85AE93
MRSSAALTAAVNDEIVMLDPEQGAYFGLSPVASRIWELIAEPATVEGICAALHTEYGVEPDTCRHDVTAFLDDLAGARLITVTP